MVTNIFIREILIYDIDIVECVCCLIHIPPAGGELTIEDALWQTIELIHTQFVVGVDAAEQLFVIVVFLQIHLPCVCLGLSEVEQVGETAHLSTVKIAGTAVGIFHGIGRFLRGCIMLFESAVSLVKGNGVTSLLLQICFMFINLFLA